MSLKLKLSEMLKRLPFYKYRYQVICDIDDYKSAKCNSYYVIIKDCKVTFYTNKLSKEQFKSDSVIVIDRLKNIFVYLFKTKIITSLSLVFLLGVFILSSFFVRNIEFTKEETYNYDVLEDVKKQMSSFGPFKKMKVDLNDLSNELRHKYSNYAYIGLRKKAGTIYIDIEELNNYPNIKDNDSFPCDIVSNVDGKVVGYEVVEGVPVVNINQIINKGDLLISGNINYQTNKESLDKLIHASGIVLIEYASYLKISIPKKEEYDLLKSETKPFYSVSLFNKPIGNNRVDDGNCIVSTEELFNIFNIFCVYKNTKYQVIKKEKLIKEDEAKVLSEKKIYEEFFKEQVSKSEKIKLIKLVSTSELEDQYVFSYLVKYIKNATSTRYYE